EGSALSEAQFKAYQDSVKGAGKVEGEAGEVGKRKITYAYDYNGEQYRVRYQEDFAGGKGHTNFSVATSDLRRSASKDKYAEKLAEHANAHRKQTGKNEVEIFAAGDKEF